MKKLLIILLSALSLTAFAQQKPRIAVYVTGEDPMNEIIANRLMAGLINSGKYMPVERSAAFLAAVSKEHEYERTGEVDDEQIAKLGAQFGIQYICVVSVLDVWDNEKYITSRILDVTSAEVIGSCSSNGSISDGGALMTALNDLTKKMNKVLDYSKESQTKRVAVYVSKTGNKNIDIILGDQLVAGFARSGEYIAVERTNAFLKQIKKESGYQQEGNVSDEDLLRLGKRFGVQYVCVAQTIPWGGAYFISSRLVDVETAEVPKIYNAENKTLNNSKDVVEVAKEIASNLSVMGSGVYVDLGLPSGTLWKDENETGGFYSYDQAMAKFGNDLPTKEQLEELKNSCIWTWTGNRYKVEGPNGNFIFLPAAGYRGCSGGVNYVGSGGGYWSFTPAGSERAWRLHFNSSDVGMYSDYRCGGRSVRLVK